MEGRRIKEKLVDAGVSQKKLAELLDVTPQTVNAILNAADVRSGTIEKLSNVLGVPVSYFYGGGAAPAAAVAEGASVGERAAVVAANYQDRSSIGGSYNSPEVVGALVAQLDRKDTQIESKDTQIERKDALIESQSRQIESLIAQITELSGKIPKP